MKAISRRFKWSCQGLVQAVAGRWMLQRRGSDILVGGENEPDFRVVAMFGTRS